jgi:hypothetical protein
MAGFYDQDDPIWGAHGLSRGWPEYGPLPPPSNYDPSGMPYPQAGTPATAGMKPVPGVDPHLNYLDPTGAPAIGTQRLQEVGPMFTMGNYGPGRMGRYGAGPTTSVGMSMGKPLGLVGPSRVGGGPGFGDLFASAYQGGPSMTADFAPPDPAEGGMAGGGLHPLQKALLAMGLVQGAGDIAGGIYDRREERKRREEDEERRKSAGDVFGRALSQAWAG